ncbi:MAG TPA: hypothetical protein DCG37_02695 [Lachnospiraceae bacterium]|nr:hypothetical protein [Lachnospiraceae bacterium]
MSSFIRKHTRTTLLTVTAVLYLILYGRFLFGDAVYMYSDVGSDSLSSSYPIIVMLSRLYETRTFSFYTLWDGLGADTTATFLQYLNPLKLLILLFGRDNFPMGILLVVFLTHMLTSLFAFGFFRRLTGNNYAALLPSLAWSFSSYMIVWGQNYSYGLCMLMFTVIMFLLQGFLMNGGRRWAVGLTLGYALFLISNYYFFYMAAAFSALYVVLYTAFSGEEGSFLLIFKRLFYLFLTGIGSVLLSAVSVLPIILSFIGSSRTGDASSGSLADLVRPFEWKTYLTFLGRFFSANIFGAGNAFTGSVNYYEAALLSTSVLFSFAVIYLFFRRGSFVRTFFSLLVTAAMLALPLAGYILTFNPRAQRYSFIICFAECIAIAFLMKDLDEHVHKASLVVSWILTPVVMIGSLALLYMTRERFGLDFRTKTLVLAAGFVVLFWFLLMLHLSDNLRPKLAVFMTLVLGAELVLLNLPGLYDRDFLTKEGFYNNFYNDGTQEASNKIRSTDESLYRICTSTEYDRANEGLVDGHNAVSVYSNTNSASLVSLTRAAGIYQKSSNFFIVGYPQYYLYTLLGGKYLITDEPDFAADTMEQTLFKEIDATGRNRTFENVNTLPFGYVYDKEISGSEFSALDGIDRMRALTASYVRTEDIVPRTAAPSGSDFDSSEKETDLSKEIYGMNDLSLQDNDDHSLTVTANGADPYFLYDLSSVNTSRKNEIQYLTLSADPEKLVGESQIQIFLTTQEHPGLCPELSYIYYLSRDYPELNILLPDRVKDIRIDFGGDAEITFREMKITTIRDAASDFSRLASTDISDITFLHDTYSATVKTPEKGCLLCVPLLYSRNWKAYVDGEEAVITNVNGGLLGITLNKGTNKVVLKYAIPYFKYGVGLSLASLAVMLLLFILPTRRKKEEPSEAEQQMT